jgi:outer membrane protein assembly factor BamD
MGRRGGALVLAVCVALTAGCTKAVQEFFGLDSAESAGSIADLNQYHDPLVLLTRADKLYDKRNYLEAAMTYERFLELHRLHPKADYAQFRLGLSDLKQFRSIDRDMEPVTKALKAFQSFLVSYPDSQYAAEVQANQRTCRLYLGESDLYIGRFYYRRGVYPAAISRFEEVIKKYGDLPVGEESLFLLGQAYAASGDQEQARKRLQQLVTQYPGSTFQERAKERLVQLNSDNACGASSAEHTAVSALC